MRTQGFKRELRENTNIANFECVRTIRKFAVFTFKQKGTNTEAQRNGNLPDRHERNEVTLPRNPA
jgi:hypothetical protein